MTTAERLHLRIANLKTSIAALTVLVAELEALLEDKQEQELAK
jgi:hypothetical protein